MARRPNNDNHLMTSIEDLYHQAEIAHTAPVTQMQPEPVTMMPLTRLRRHNRMRLPILKSKPIHLGTPFSAEASGTITDELESLIFSGLKSPLKEQPVNVPDAEANARQLTPSAYLTPSDLANLADLADLADLEPSENAQTATEETMRTGPDKNGTENTSEPDEYSASQDPIDAIRQAVQAAGLPPHKSPHQNTEPKSPKPSQEPSQEAPPPRLAQKTQPELAVPSPELLQKLSALIEEEVGERLMLEQKRAAKKPKRAAEISTSAAKKQKTKSASSVKPKNKEKGS